LTLASRKLTFLGGLWLALVTVFVLALDPIDAAPAREISGSPFSFFTSDVSLGPSRAPAPDRLVRPRASADPGVNSTDAATPPRRAFALPAGPRPAAVVAPRPDMNPPAGAAVRIARARAPPPPRA